MRYISLLLLCCTILSCENQSTPPISDSSIDNPFTVRIGEGVTIDRANTQVRFSKLIGDSRCAADVTCVWEGRADIQLSFLQAGKDTSTIPLSIRGYVTIADTKAHQTKDTLGYLFTLMQLDPYPRSDVRINPNAYTATISVVKK